MTTVLLVRHGLTKMTGPVLAGWTPGVGLDDRGREQAAALAVRLAPVALTAIVSSPLERCRETAEAIAAARPPGDVKTEIDERVGECGYGEWTGRKLEDLRDDPLWPVVQAHPSAVTFPGGESLAAVQRRAVDAVRDWNGRVDPGATYLICTHGDVIKAIVADALGLHLDQFQRIQADPASLSVIRYTKLRPFVVRLNDIGPGLEGLVEPDENDGASSSDAPVGGGAAVTGRGPGHGL